MRQIDDKVKSSRLELILSNIYFESINEGNGVGNCEREEVIIAYLPRIK